MYSNDVIISAIIFSILSMSTWYELMQFIRHIYIRGILNIATGVVIGHHTKLIYTYGQQSQSLTDLWSLLWNDHLLSQIIISLGIFCTLLLYIRLLLWIAFRCKSKYRSQIRLISYIITTIVAFISTVNFY